MRELKDRAECRPKRERGDEVEDENLPPRMKRHRNYDCPTDEEELPSDERCDLPWRDGRKRVDADQTLLQDHEVIPKDPLRQQEAIEKPQIELLIAMPRSSTLRRGQARKRSEIEVEIDAIDIRVRILRERT